MLDKYTFNCTAFFKVGKNEMRLNYSWVKSKNDIEISITLGGDRGTKLMEVTSLQMESLSFINWNVVSEIIRSMICNDSPEGIEELFRLILMAVPIPLKHNAEVLVYTGKKSLKDDWYSINIYENTVNIDISYEWNEKQISRFKKYLHTLKDTRMTTSDVVEWLNRMGTKITPRIIKNYIEKGLIDSPSGKKRVGRSTQNVFNDKEFEIIRRIREQQLKGISLDEIKKGMEKCQ